MTYIIIPILFVALYVGIFLWYKQKKKKSAEAFSNLNMQTESRKAEAYKSEFLNGDFSFLKKHLKDAPIDAFTIANLEYGKGDFAKDIAKDAVKTIASLGVVKHRTVQTPKYLVLSGSDLHLLDTGVDGNVERHLIFDGFRLQKSTIEELPEETSSWKKVTYGDFLLKKYKVSLETDGKAIHLIIPNGITETSISQGTAQAILSNNTEKQVKQFVLGNFFLNKLGDKSPNLRVKTYLP